MRGQTPLTLPVWCLISDINTATACCESNSIAQDCRHWAESTQDMTYNIQMFTGEHLTRLMFTFETQMFCENWDNECVLLASIFCFSQSGWQYFYLPSFSRGKKDKGPNVVKL